MGDHSCRLTAYADRMLRLAEVTRFTRRGWWARRVARLFEREAVTALLACADEHGTPGTQADYRLTA